MRDLSSQSLHLDILERWRIGEYSGKPGTFWKTDKKYPEIKHWPLRPICQLGPYRPMNLQSCVDFVIWTLACQTNLSLRTLQTHGPWSYVGIIHHTCNLNPDSSDQFVRRPLQTHGPSIICWQWPLHMWPEPWPPQTNLYQSLKTKGPAIICWLWPKDNIFETILQVHVLWKLYNAVSKIKVLKVLKILKIRWAISDTSIAINYIMY